MELAKIIYIKHSDKECFFHAFKTFQLGQNFPNFIKGKYIKEIVYIM